MDRRNVFLLLLVSSLVILLTLSKWLNWRLTANDMESAHHWHTPTGEANYIYSVQDIATDRTLNETTVTRNVSSFLNKTLQKHVKGKKHRLIAKRTNVKNETKHRHEFRTTEGASAYLTGKKNTSMSYFSYSDESVYSAIQRQKAEARYKYPENESCEKRTPQCIIIGVKKAGTRELLDFMSMHPNIVIKRKPYEIGYFSSKRYSNKSSGTEWYRNQMPCSYSDQITVTKYPWYFSNPVAAERIYNFNKTIKLIALVREPVERFVSGYTFSYIGKTLGKHGEDFSKLPPIGNQVLLKTGEINKDFEEVRLSSYDTALRNYLKFFTLDQILIIELSEFKDNPYFVLKRVESFLGLQHTIAEDNFVYNSEKRFYCINDHNKAACYGKQRGRVKQPQLTGDFRKKLENYFRPHNEQFFNIIGKRYNW